MAPVKNEEASMHVTSRAASLPLTSDVGGELLPLEFSEAPAVTFDFDVDAAYESDHAAIHSLLLATFQEPTIGNFRAINSAPRYEPSDRLLIRLGGEIVAHVFLNRRSMYFGGCEIVSTDLRYLVTLPEFRSQGLASHLMKSALEEMKHSRTIVATSRTLMPAFFESHGWVRCGRRCYSTSTPHNVLAHLGATEKSHSMRMQSAAPDRQLDIRMLRVSELDQSSELYNALQEDTFGAYHRTSSDWRWLLATRSHDQVYAVFELPDEKSELYDSDPDFMPEGKLSGYAVVQGGRIIEFFVLPKMPDVERLLLDRICHDLIEDSIHAIELHGPPTHRLHPFFAAAGGKYHYSDRDGGRVLMATILDRLKYLQSIRPLLWERARTAELPTGGTLGIRCGDESFTLTVSKRSVSVKTGCSTDHFMELSESVFCQLLLGHESAAELINAGVVKTSDLDTTELARVFFPQVSLWRPVYDDVDG
jgi:predicted acetyltransferase